MTALLAESAIRLRALLRKEFRQLLRDPRMRFFVVVPPLIQLLVFGYAASYDVRRADIGVVDPVRSEQTRALLGAVTADGTFTASAFADMRDAARAIDRGTVRAVLHFSPGFDHDHRVQLIADGSDSNSALMIVGQLAQSLQRAAGATAPIAIEERAWFNPNLDDRWFFVPGIIATVLLISTGMLIAMAVVREREIGTLERMMVTPVARIEFLLGKIAPVVCIGIFDVALVCVVAVFWFEVPFRCTVWSLTVATLLYLASTLGIGLLISSFVVTQQQAVLWMFFVTMPMILLSGFAFPVANMPEPAQWFAAINPLSHFLYVLRDMFLKGGGIAGHATHVAAMAALGFGAVVVSALRLR
jgi:ABC-2 type transport system permease protein